MILHPVQFGLPYARRDRELASRADPQERARRCHPMVRLLPAEDRRLVDLVIVQGRSHRDVARLVGVCPGVVTRRSRRLRNLLASATARAIAEHLDLLSDLHRQIAVDHFFHRIGVSVIAEHRSMDRQEVARHLDFIRGWARGLHRAAFVDPSALSTSSVSTSPVSTSVVSAASH